MDKRRVDLRAPLCKQRKNKKIKKKDYGWIVLGGKGDPLLLEPKPTKSSK